MFTNITLRGVVANLLDSDFVVNKFDILVALLRSFSDQNPLQSVVMLTKERHGEHKKGW